jgi:hypothetical protein
MRTYRDFSGLNIGMEVEESKDVVYFLSNCFEKVLMRNQAILTLMSGKEERLKLAPEHLSARGCEFTCNEQQVGIFRDNAGALICKSEFKVRLALFPHRGPLPQYIVAIGEIVSVRRCTQSRYRIGVNFKQVGQDGYRLIAEHLNDPLASIRVPLNQEQSKSA